ncbi:MAG: hypothetical protein GY932_07600 [Arcobacter sp.]|nr:hypothetical protein [Arcobacter sp.]
MFKIIVLSLLFVFVVNANEINKDKKDLEKAISLFNKATSSKGLEKDVNLAIDSFKKLKISTLRDVYIGSLTMKLAKYTFWPWKRLAYVDDGSKLLDQSVRLEPNNIQYRFIRFYSYLNVPDFLKKEAFLQEDLRYLITMYKSKRLPPLINDKALKAMVLFFNKYENVKKRDVYFKLITNDKIKQNLKKIIDKE